MPARAVLNAYYAWMTKDMDSKQRKEFDAALYGWKAENERADRELARIVNGPGGEG